jgi:hypothetical protein
MLAPLKVQQPCELVGHDGPPRMYFSTGRPRCFALDEPTIMQLAQ